VLKSFNPSVSRGWLLLLAGLMWSAVGILLCALAYQWLVGLHSSWAVWIGGAGLVAALLTYRFGFLHIAQKNIDRLKAILEKVCVFAFMPWKSYLLVAGMMTLGITLRHSTLPREYLAVVYTTIGAALFFSSLHYYPHVWAEIKARR
jgi:hypothetical protein